MQEWDDTRVMAFDFETSGTLPEYGLQPWRVAQGLSWATSLVTLRVTEQGPRLGGGLDPARPDMKLFLEEALDTKSTIAGWNTTFDIGWLIAYGFEAEVMRLKWLDGMLLWRHWFIEPEYDVTDMYKRKPYTLKACVAQYMPEQQGYEEEIDFHSTDPAERAKLHKYNQKDVIFTHKLTRKWYEALLNDDPRRLRAALIEADSLPLVAKANLDGMVLDSLATRELAQHLDNVADDRLAQLAEHGVTEKIVRSPTQLAGLMFDDWKLPVIKENVGAKTGKVSRSTDKEVLHELSFVDDRVAKLRQYREALNNKKKFALTPLESADYNGDYRTRPSGIIFGTYSGRMTYASAQGKNKEKRQTGFALHQEKRGSEYRNAITAPPGYQIVEFDAAGQEFRWMAIASGDETMLSLCLPGEDAHSYMGAQVNALDYKGLIQSVKSGDKTASEVRRLGKVANLSLQYRTSAAKLKAVARVDYHMPMELPEAQKIHQTYQRVYKGVPRYWADQIALTQRLGYVETIAGRRVVVQGDWGRGGNGWRMGSTAINYRIQGTGADQKYLAMSVMRPYLVKTGSYFGWDLHDGIYFFVPDAVVDRFVVEGRHLLNNLPYKKAWDFTPPIPLPWDCKVGTSWGDLKEIH